MACPIGLGSADREAPPSPFGSLYRCIIAARQYQRRYRDGNDAYNVNDNDNDNAETDDAENDDDDDDDDDENDKDDGDENRYAILMNV
jgi:hypothetical protein